MATCPRSESQAQRKGFARNLAAEYESADTIISRASEEECDALGPTGKKVRLESDRAMQQRHWMTAEEVVRARDAARVATGNARETRPPDIVAHAKATKKKKREDCVDEQERRANADAVLPATIALENGTWEGTDLAKRTHRLERSQVNLNREKTSVLRVRRVGEPVTRPRH